MATEVQLYSSVQNTTVRLNSGTAYGGCTFTVQQLNGWLNPTPSVKSFDRMAADGKVITKATHGSRKITVTGTATADASSNLWDGMRTLSDAMDCTTGDGKVRVVEGAGSTRHAVVRLARQPTMQFVGPRTLRFTVQFEAQDPDLSTGP